MPESPFDPEYQSVARFLPRGIARSWNLPLIRMLGTLTGLGSDPVNVEIVDTGAGPARVHRPASSGDEPLPAVLWLHGGGFLLGSPKQDDGLCRQIADELGAIVVAPVYRLAPKHAFPAALDDAYAALACCPTPTTSSCCTTSRGTTRKVFRLCNGPADAITVCTPGTSATNFPPDN